MLPGRTAQRQPDLGVSNLREYFEAQRMEMPYRIAPTVKLTVGFDQDLAELRKIHDSLKNDSSGVASWTAWIAYARDSDDAIAARIRSHPRAGQRVEDAGADLFRFLVVHTPERPGRQGWEVDDGKYQQRVWNATKNRKINFRRRPLVDTPWLTVNDPDLTRSKSPGSRSAVAELSLRLRDFVAAGNRDLILGSISTTSRSTGPAETRTGRRHSSADFIRCGRRGEEAA